MANSRHGYKEVLPLCTWFIDSWAYMPGSQQQQQKQQKQQQQQQQQQRQWQWR